MLSPGPAMISVAEQFGNLRDTLGSILGIFALARWIRSLLARLAGRPPPADAAALTASSFARFQGRSPALGPDGRPGPPKASRKPLLFFLAAAFGLPYLMSRLIRALAASQGDEDQRRLRQQALLQQPLDPTKLEFCRLLYDYLPAASPPPASSSSTLELHARKGDLVAVLSKNDPAGCPSDWWLCRSRDGRHGYLPSTYLELIRRPDAKVKTVESTADVDPETCPLSSTATGPETKDGKKATTTTSPSSYPHLQ